MAQGQSLATIDKEWRSGAALSVGITTPADIRARRKALGLKVIALARASRLGTSYVMHPSLDAIARLDMALRVLEAGGCLGDARAAIGAVKRGPKPGARPPVPSWPKRTGEALPDGPCFTDAVTMDGGVYRYDTPATPLPTQSSMGC